MNFQHILAHKKKVLFAQNRKVRGFLYSSLQTLIQLKIIKQIRKQINKKMQENELKE